MLWEEFERESIPSYLSVNNGSFFKTGSISTINFIFDEDSNVGAFEETGEQEEIATTNTFIGNQKSVRVKKWMKRIPVSFEAFKTDQVGKRERIGQQIGERARMTKDKVGIIRTYGDAYDGTYFTCPDGVALASNSHKTLKGYTVDNLETGATTPTTAWNAIVSLQTQLAQDGEVGGFMPSGAVTNCTKYKLLKEVLNSEKIAQSAENDLNIFETDYGQISIKQSPFLNSSADGGTYKATAVHFVSDKHMVMRKVLADMSTDLIEPKYSSTDSWEYRSRYLEVCFPGTYEGYVMLAGA